MRHLETEVMGGINQTQIDVPRVFYIETPRGKLTYDEVIENTPAISSTYDGAYSRQMVIGEDGELPFWDPTKFYPVGRLASFHGRNIDITAPVFVEDKYGNKFGSLCLKGTDMSKPEFMKHVTAERDYIIRGFQESLVMERVLRASQLLREHNIGTEYICGLTLPTTFPLDKSGDPVFDMKEAVELPELLEHLATVFAKKEAFSSNKSPLELKTEMIDKFKDCDYLISYRAMDCPIRFGQLTEDQPGFSLAQPYIDIARKSLPPEERDNYLPEGITRERYISDYFSLALGTNLGDMHRLLKVTHGFLHSHNITALGSIVDLDSCKGEALGLGDEPRKPLDYLHDVKTAISSIKTVIGNANFRNNQDTEDKREKFNSESYSVRNFLLAYVYAAYESGEERVDYLIQLLVNTEMFGEDCNEIAHMRQSIYGVYDIIVTDETTEIEPTLEKLRNYEAPSKDSTALSMLPNFCLKPIEKNILGEEYMFRSPTDDETGAFHPFAALLHNVALDQIIKNLDKNSISYTSLVAQFTKKLLLDQPNQKDDRLKDFVTKIYSSQLANDLEKISAITHDKLTSVPLITNDKIGEIRGNNGAVPILYLNSLKEYQQAIAALIGNEQIIAQSIEQDEFKIESLQKNDVIIADALRIRPITDGAIVGINDAFEALKYALDFDTLTPLLVIKGVDNPNPKLHIISAPGYSSKEEVIGYSRLLDIIAPRFNDLKLF